jgi:hypothetical protein
MPVIPSPGRGFVPNNFASSQFQYGVLLNDLNTNDPAIYPEMLKKYGNENYAIILQLLGRTVTEERVFNKQFAHFEDRNLHSSVRSNAAVAGAGAGQAVTIPVHPTDHYENGAKSPVRVNEVVMINSSGVQAQIVAINTAVPNAHTMTIKPLNSADVIASAGSTGISANELFLFRGAVNVGEGSDKISGLAPIWDKIVNTTTEHRDDFNISDVADMEKQVIPIAGTPYYRVKAIDNMNRRYMNNQFFKIMEGVQVNNISGTYGTIGVIPRVAANGTNVQYTAGAPTLADIRALTRGLNFYGSPGEYHALTDFSAKADISDFLFTTFKTAFNAVSYESVGGNKEAAVAYGFDTFRMDNVTLHFFNNPMFNTEQVYKRSPSLASYYNNYMLLVPQRTNTDPQNGMSYPSLQIVYQLAPDGTRIQTFPTGGAAPSNKTTKMEHNITMISYPGARVFGAQQFASLKGV